MDNVKKAQELLKQAELYRSDYEKAKVVSRDYVKKNKSKIIMMFRDKVIEETEDIAISADLRGYFDEGAEFADLDTNDSNIDDQSIDVSSEIEDLYKNFLLKTAKNEFSKDIRKDKLRNWTRDKKIFAIFNNAVSKISYRIPVIKVDGPLMEIDIDAQLDFWYEEYTHDPQDADGGQVNTGWDDDIEADIEWGVKIEEYDPVMETLEVNIFLTADAIKSIDYALESSADRERENYDPKDS